MVNWLWRSTKKNGYLLLLCAVLLVVFASCAKPAGERIIGAWKIDSVYDYYNGFTFTNRHPYPQEVHTYRPDQTMLRQGMGEQLIYLFECKDSTLNIQDAHGQPWAEFIILQLNDHKMVLRKDKSPVFPGKNQLHFEIRYFSKVDSLATK